MKVLNMDDPSFAEQFAEATGIKPGDTVTIRTPQFEREDGLKPIENPRDLLEQIHTLFPETLKEIGMRPWGEYGLWLFPHEWYPHLQAGMKVVDIFGAEEIFKPGVTDDDMRFGMLSFGIVPDFEKTAAA